MKRLIRIIFNGLTVLSLLICMGVVGLWVRSYRSENQISMRVGEDRYTLRSERGQLSLYGPPDQSASTDLLAKAHLLRNDDVGFLVIGRVDGEGLFDDRELEVYGAVDDTVSQSNRMVPRTLLANLEDPSKFAAAHAALEGYHPGLVGNGLTEKLVGRAVRVDWDSLRVEIQLDMIPSELDNHGLNFAVYRGSAAARIDPAQLPAIRKLWHDRLDKRIAGVPYWMILMCAVMPVAARAAGLRRRKAMRQKGFCRVCGYDLRATPDRCPECGAVPTKVKT
jgi:hypothetical protein